MRGNAGLKEARPTKERRQQTREFLFPRREETLSDPSVQGLLPGSSDSVHNPVGARIVFSEPQQHNRNTGASDSTRDFSQHRGKLRRETTLHKHMWKSYREQ